MTGIGGRGHIPLPHPPPMASKLAMHGILTGLAPPFTIPCIHHWPHPSNLGQISIEGVRLRDMWALMRCSGGFRK